MSSSVTSSVLEIPSLTPDEVRKIINLPFIETGRWALYRWAVRLMAPLLEDRMTGAQVLGLATKQKVEFAKDESLETRAIRKMYSDAYENDMPVGVIGVPWENFYAMCRGAGVKIQYGSGKNDRISKAGGSTELNDMFRIRDKFLPLLRLNGEPYHAGTLLDSNLKPVDWSVDLRKGNATQGEGAVGIIRPRWEEGAFIGHVEVNTDILSEPNLRSLLIAAWSSKGCCSARPEKGMPFGRAGLLELSWVGGAEPKKVAVAGRRSRKKASDETDGQPVNRLKEVANGEANGNGETDGNGEA